MAQDSADTMIPSSAVNLVGRHYFMQKIGSVVPDT